MMQVGERLFKQVGGEKISSQNEKRNIFSHIVWIFFASEIALANERIYMNPLKKFFFEKMKDDENETLRLLHFLNAI